MMKSSRLIICLILAAVFIMSSGCKKEKNTITEYIGTVVEGTTMAPLSNVKVSVTNGSRVLVSTNTDEEGAFSLLVNILKLTDRDSLLLDGNPDLPYQKKYELREPGKEQYDYRSLVLYTKSNTEVKTSEVTSITANSATCGGEITCDADVHIVERGVCWSKEQYPTIVSAHTSDGQGGGTYTSYLTNLEEKSSYYVRAYAKTKEGEVLYGEQKPFTTSAFIRTNTVTGITANMAVCGGVVAAENDNVVLERGVCWSKNEEPGINDAHTSDGQGNGSFTSNITGLDEQTTYFVRAFARTESTIKYGDQKVFSTPALFPSFQYNGSTYYVHPDAGKMNWESAVSYCENLTSAGYSDWFLPDKDELNTMYVNRESIGGFVTTGSDYNSDDCRYWSSTRPGSNPWYQNFYNGYQSTATAGSYLRVRPVRKDGGGGTTPTAPTVTTDASPTITYNSATCGGNVTSTGGADITDRGVYYSTSPNPVTTGLLKPSSTSGSGTGIFTCNLTDLSANTKYYFCAYARNSVGPSYGAVEEFTTLNNPTAPTVTTGDYSNVGCTSATCGGSITAESGVSINQRGVCYGTSPNPTTSNLVFNSGTGTGSFTCNLTGLSPDTKYYYRAFAIYNGSETKYGEQKDFTTLLYATFDYAGTTYYVHPEVGTMEWQSAVDYCEGLTFAGYSDWFLPNKDELNAMYVYRNSIGDFVTTGNTESHYWSSTKTQYDDEAWYQRFSTGSQSYTSLTSYKRVRPIRKIDGGGGTTPTVPTVTTNEPSNVQNNSATCGGIVVSDGGADITRRGVCYSTSQNPTTSNQVVNSGTGTGSFSCNLTGLNPNTKYYVRAFAINSAGTGYGTQQDFTTGSGGEPIDGWLYYDDIDVVGHVGLTNGGTFYWANMFPPSMLSPYAGTGVKLIEVHLDVTGNYTLQIYQGGQDSPGTLLFQDNCNVATAGGYVQFTLSSPVYFDATQNLWIVIGKTHAAGEYPAGYSNLSSNPNSRWISIQGEWMDSEEYTWVMHIYVTNSKKGLTRIEVPSYNHKNNGNKELIKSSINY